METAAAAAANPNIYFIGLDTPPAAALPNLAGLLFHEDQSGFLAGALAASLSKTGTIAAVLASDQVPAVAAYAAGYAAGARYVNPAINVLATHHPGAIVPSFNDPAWGATTAQQALDQGADVIFAAAGQTGNGALNATAAAPGAGTDRFCIGVDSDQWQTEPAAHPCLVSSAMKQIAPAVGELVAAYAAGGTMQPGVVYGATALGPYHDLADKVPQAVQDALVAIAAGLKDGSIATGYQP